MEKILAKVLLTLGELKKRTDLYLDNIEYIIHRRTKEDALKSILTFRNSYHKLFDEAKKEFPCFKCQVRDNPAYCVNQGRGLCPLYPCYVFALKWFGEVTKK